MVGVLTERKTSFIESEEAVEAVDDVGENDKPTKIARIV